MELLFRGAAQGSFGLDEIIAQRPDPKVVREFFRSQAGDICRREDQKMLGSDIKPLEPPRPLGLAQRLTQPAAAATRPTARAPAKTPQRRRAGKQ